MVETRCNRSQPVTTSPDRSKPVRTVVTCLDLSRFVSICFDLSRFVSICLDFFAILFRFVSTCLDLLRRVVTVSTATSVATFHDSRNMLARSQPFAPDTNRDRLRLVATCCNFTVKLVSICTVLYINYIFKKSESLLISTQHP